MFCFKKCNIKTGSDVKPKIEGLNVLAMYKLHNNTMGDAIWSISMKAHQDNVC